MPLHREFSGVSSETTVTLPSIRDIFPELTGESRSFSSISNSLPKEMESSSFTRPNAPYSPTTRRGSDPHLYKRPECSQDGPRIFESQRQQPQQPPPSPIRGHHHTRSLPPFPTASRRHHPRTGSFDPEPHRTGSNEPSAGVACGSAPAFRVSMPRRGGSPDDLMMGQDGDQKRKRASDLAGGNRPAYAREPTGTPALIQFSLAASSSSSPRRNQSKKQSEAPGPSSSSERDKGKKHECPHCSKRFNRPSSLRIHVNTHTGLKPFECPFPHCGRQFNVNSNMRRHYRNHIRVGTGPGTQGPTCIPFVGTPPEHALRFDFGWRHEGPTGVLWESLEDVDGTDDEEMDELQDEDDPETGRLMYTPDSTPSPRPMSSSSRVPVNGSDGNARHGSTFSYHGSPRAGYRYAPSIVSQSCKGSNVSTTLRPAFPLRSPHDRLNRNGLE